MLVLTPTFTYFGQLRTGSGSESSLSAVELGGGELELLEAAAADDLALDQVAGRAQGSKCEFNKRINVVIRNFLMNEMLYSKVYLTAYN